MGNLTKNRQMEIASNIRTCLDKLLSRVETEKKKLINTCRKEKNQRPHEEEIG
jgi:hypothetical protein